MDEGSKGLIVEENITFNTSGKPVRHNRNQPGWHTWKNNSFNVKPTDAQFPWKIAAMAGPQPEESQIAPTETVYREATEWCDLWVPQADRPNMPRVLLIGDSITKGYYPGVEQQLKGKASVARLATSRFVSDPLYCEELALALKQYRYKVIHFNNGLHGIDYSDESYRRGMEKSIRFIQEHAPEAKLILVNSTPIRGMPARNTIVNRRNVIVAELAAQHELPLNDLNTPMRGNNAYYTDNYHYKQEAKAIQSKQVAETIAKYLR